MERLINPFNFSSILKCQGGDQDGGGVRCGTHLLSQTHFLKKNLHVERFTLNIHQMSAEDLKPPKRTRNPPHNWVEQKEKKMREMQEKRN